MKLRWVCVLVFAVGVASRELTDEEYYSMPALFSLDGLEACLASRRALYCLGSFDLLPHTNHRLLRTIQEFSADKYHFNHTHIHRGYCVTSRCGYTQHMHTASLRQRFEHCVDNITRSQYGLQTNLTRLEYCRSGGGGARPLDPLDLPERAFAAACLVLLLANTAGTAYDLLRDHQHKPNRYLWVWSARVNWARLTARHEGDPRLAALRPLQGVKALTLLLVMLAHSVLAHHLTYIQNPVFLERASHHPLVAFFQNGTSIVHTFLMVSSFLLAYNLLLHSERHTLSLRLLPTTLLHRLTRIVPLYVFVVGLAATWWVRAGDGPLWPPLVGAESQRCRDKWWSQLLFVNNLVRPDHKCLIHTWFLAVDWQLYVVCAALVVVVGARAGRAARLLAALLALAVLGNGLAAYHFHLRPMLSLMFPELMRSQFEGEASFKWLYAAPWDGAPAALIGLLAAYAHHSLQRAQRDLRDSRAFVAAYRCSVPLMFVWVVAGYWLKGESSRAALAAYAALDRPVFVGLTATALLGFIHQVDSLWWRFLSWRGWEVLGRLSLPVYLVHWLLALSSLAARPHASPASVHEIGGHFLWTVFVTYWAALPLHLFIEQPMQKFLQTLFS